ncbi:ankyrin repeat and sterile alpha motif domain-containing protein 1B-like [Copidosoma floridanum]|uniref:ankyrin repeat and sterile alpha motif domain-containing protein 1B-like n=1 Tax=Copidosoma floridanum TaxID=29053 RepID=UPI000C6F88C4|nr:ankyrin repeat and sterile alpha motif domain-containing protein 1B-like [Copidosoma floridanum]
MGKDQELLEAARNGNVAVVEKILGQRAKRSGPLASLRRGQGANVQDSSGYSALHHAALNGHKEVVKLLLQHEASTNIVDAKGSSPLHLAAWSGNSEILRLILSQGPSVPNVNLTTKDNETALHCAAQYGHTEVVAQLLQHGCDPSIRNSRGECALDLAAQYGRLDTVELLVRNHPELIESLRSASSSLIFPHTPLHLASRNGHRACVEVLLDAGVDVNTRTSAGTAMHEAALCGKMEVVRTLLDRGVDLSIKDSRHNTVLDLLSQFPVHVTQDITAVIKRHRASCGIESDAESENLPPIPVQGSNSLGSPYENVRPGDDLSPMDPSIGERSSPSRWQLYHKPRDDDRRVSANSAMSLEEESYSGEILDEDAWRHLHLTEDSGLSSVFDSVFMSMSMSDTLNSINTLASSDQTPEDRPLNTTTTTINTTITTLIITPSRDTIRGSDSGLYQIPPVSRGIDVTSGGYASEDQLSLTPGCYGGRESDQLSVSSSSSIGGPSPRDRRCIPSDASSSGIYLPMGPISNSLHSPASSSKVSPTPPKKPPRRNLSVSPTHLQSQMSLSVDGHVGPGNYEYLFLARTGGAGRGQIDLEELQARRGQLRHVTRSVDQYVDMKPRGEHRPAESDAEPVAITSLHGNRPMRVTNPRRKLRRHAYERYSGHENYEMDSSPVADKSPGSEGGPERATYVSSAFFTLKSSQESLLDDSKRDGPEEATDKRLKRVQMLLPTSPTHYAQPPTPDHPPPSALQAEKSIHERIRPLSQVYKRRSRDMETETDEELLLQFPVTGTMAHNNNNNNNNNNNGNSLDASSGSLSSVSLSDKSMSTDTNVEEYFGDVPFAGLLKGSVSVAERPRTLRRLRNVYSPAAVAGVQSMGTGAEPAGDGEPRDLPRASSGPSTGPSADKDTDKTLSVMSPFDEQEEWAKISEIMASFGTGLVRESVFVKELENEFQARLGLSSDTGSPCALTLVGQWLSKLNLAEYESLFVNYGYDDLEFINGLLEDTDLKEMGIMSEKERAVILDAVSLLNKRVEKQIPSHQSANQTVDEWLDSIHLSGYADLFRRHLYTDMDRVRRVWEVELAAVLEIQKPGHRKRILTSVNSDSTNGQGTITKSYSEAYVRNGRAESNLDDLNKDLNTLKTNIQQLKDEIREKLPDSVQNNGVATPTSTTAATSSTTTATTTATTNTTGTLRHRKNRPAPPPPLKPQSTQQNGTTVQAPEHLEIRGPSELLFGVPSTLKTQWRHQPKDLVTGCVTYVANYLGSTVVKELRGTESTKKSIQKLKKVQDCRDHRCTPGITLSISYRGVQFLNPLTDEPICEHEIRNIHCACQDADDLTHFAYITKDHASRTHFCHVFCVPTMDQATEIILTLGQAFEVAYQIALKDKLGGHATRSQSATQLASLASSTSNSSGNAKLTSSLSVETSQPPNNDRPSNHHTHTAPRTKPRSKTLICNPFIGTGGSTNNSTSPSSSLAARQQLNRMPSPNKTTTTNSNSHFNSSSNSANAQAIKLLATHGRSHSVNDIKLNGSQMKVRPAPVDDIGIGVKDMKPGSRAPIAISEEL